VTARQGLSVAKGELLINSDSSSRLAPKPYLSEPYNFVTAETKEDQMLSQERLELEPNLVVFAIRSLGRMCVAATIIWL